MNAPDNSYDDEISLADILRTIWDGRLLIALITAGVTAIGAVVSSTIEQTFEGSLEIRPIPSAMALRYGELNALNYFKIEPTGLLSLFLEDVSQRKSLVDAIKKHNYVKPERNETGQAFEDRVLATAYSFRINKPADPEGKNKPAKGASTDWTITFTTSDPEGAQVVLSSALKESEASVRDLIKARFTQQTGVTTRANRHSLEDLQLSIRNSIEDYEKQVRNRLAFLSEQAAIAKSLGIAKSTIESQTFQAGNSLLTNVKTESPFYLRGYEAIEKEIQLLSTRKGKREFINELIEIEKKTREIEQNRTVERAQVAFNESPIQKGEFAAASYDVSVTEFRPKTRPSIVLLVCILGGFFLGLLVTFVRKALASNMPASGAAAAS